MKTFICIALCGLMVVALAQDETTQQLELVPFIANICNTGCPATCQALRTFCLARGPIDCDEQKTQCDAECAATCACITACGPDCDTFESNCVANGLPQVGGVFCPVTGGVCDVSCLVNCPQNVFSGILQQNFQQAITGVQAFIQNLIASQASKK